MYCNNLRKRIMYFYTYLLKVHSYLCIHSFRSVLQVCWSLEQVCWSKNKRSPFQCSLRLSYATTVTTADSEGYEAVKTKVTQQPYQLVVRLIYTFWSSLSFTSSIQERLL